MIRGCWLRGPGTTITGGGCGAVRDESGRGRFSTLIIERVDCDLPVLEEREEREERELRERPPSEGARMGTDGRICDGLPGATAALGGSVRSVTVLSGLGVGAMEV
jgi:hypothetical protein